MSQQYQEIFQLIMETIQTQAKKNTQSVPVGISNRHIHLCQEDLEAIFGQGYQLTHMKDLSQIGQFACKEVVTIVGPKGAIEKVRVLGPVRNKTQVEILKSDCFKLGIKGVVRISGDLQGSPGLTIVGPKGSVQLKEGAIIAQRHIHMTPEDAQRLGVTDKEIVDIKVDNPRGGIYSNVVVRATNTSSLECHLDTEEANAMDMDSKSTIIIKKQ